MGNKSINYKKSLVLVGSSTVMLGFSSLLSDDVDLKSASPTAPAIPTRLTNGKPDDAIRAAQPGAQAPAAAAITASILQKHAENKQA